MRGGFAGEFAGRFFRILRGTVGFLVTGAQRAAEDGTTEDAEGTEEAARWRGIRAGASIGMARWVLLGERLDDAFGKVECPRFFPIDFPGRRRQSAVAFLRSWPLHSLAVNESLC
jgi:hypothetical protein